MKISKSRTKSAWVLIVNVKFNDHMEQTTSSFQFYVVKIFKLQQNFFT